MDAHKLIVAAVQQQMMNFAVRLVEAADEGRILGLVVPTEDSPFHKLTGGSRMLTTAAGILAMYSTAS